MKERAVLQDGLRPSALFSDSQLRRITTVEGDDSQGVCVFPVVERRWGRAGTRWSREEEKRVVVGEKRERKKKNRRYACITAFTEPLIFCYVYELTLK